MQRIKDWYRWRANGRSRNSNGALSSKDLRRIYYTDRTRERKAYEVFAELYSDAVKSAYEQACVEKGVTGRQKLPVWHATASSLWAQASEQQREAVNEKLAKGNGPAIDALGEMFDKKGDNTPESYQQCVIISLDIFDAVLIFLQLPEHTSQCFTGDPRACLQEGRRDGRVDHPGTSSQIGRQDQHDVVSPNFIRLLSCSHPSLSRLLRFQFGDDEETPLFSEAWSGHDEVFLEELGKFATKYVFRTSSPYLFPFPSLTLRSRGGCLPVSQPSEKGG